MTTRDDLVAEIMDDLRRTSATDNARVLKAVSAAIKHYQPKRFYFNESRNTTFSTVVGQTSYSFAGASPDINPQFYRIDSVVLEDTTNDYVLRKRDYLEIERLQDGGSTDNRPYSYAYINQALMLYPSPDAVYTMRITGHIKLAEPAAGDTANNQWFVEAYELIRSRAKMYLYGHVFHNPGMAQAMAVADQEAMLTLASATNDKAGLGSIVPTQF